MIGVTRHQLAAIAERYAELLDDGDELILDHSFRTTGLVATLHGEDGSFGEPHHLDHDGTWDDGWEAGDRSALDTTRGRRALDDGRSIVLYRMLPGQTRLVIGPTGEGYYDDAWCFHDEHAAMQAMLCWDGHGDPPGPWYRHIGSGSRREHDPDGNVIREWVQR